MSVYYYNLEKGEQTIGDLRLIVLPLEMVFLFGWLFLQLYDSCEYSQEQLFISLTIYINETNIYYYLHSKYN